MTEKEFKDIEEMLLNILKCKTQPHRNIIISMIISLLREKVVK